MAWIYIKGLLTNISSQSHLALMWRDECANDCVAQKTQITIPCKSFANMCRDFGSFKKPFDHSTRENR